MQRIPLQMGLFAFILSVFYFYFSIFYLFIFYILTLAYICLSIFDVIFTRYVKLKTLNIYVMLDDIITRYGASMFEQFILHF